jgi:hypothetical protein
MNASRSPRPPGPTLNLALCVGLLLVGLSRPVLALGEPSVVDFTPTGDGFPLAHAGRVAPLLVDSNDWPGVLRAAGDFATDVRRVTGFQPALLTQPGTGREVLIVGTLGRHALVDRLVAAGRLNVSAISNQWESWALQTVSDPLPGVTRALVLTGSDKRGTIYGLYALSEQIGVSPWYWWADVPPKKHDTLFIQPGTRVQGPPAVKYRGIFLNDEYPALGGWAREKFGGFNHRFYTNVFELILRLRGNFLWPAMWNDSFATDDPRTPKLADEYGIVVSTSHHEPMMRAWKEWGRAGNRPGSWDYAKNDEKLRAFWREGLERTRDFEKVITLGMRGDGDEPMSEEKNIALLERIVADQRRLIAEIIHPDVTTVPQVWALYKEVQGYYERGMRVPDDVTLLWADDNWGNIRRLPTPDERLRPGGAGVYYHFDYVGGPRNYKWINVTPLPKIWEQMNLAYHHDANRIWVVNVGDLKPMEVPIEFFLTMAWNPPAWPKERLGEFLELWATREFGPAHAAAIADIVAQYAKFNRRRTPELLEPGTFSLVHYREAERVLAAWKNLADRAEAIFAQLSPEARDAFFQLVLYPAKACYIVNDLYVTVARNRLYARQGRASANDLAARARALFQADADLTRAYHQLGGGRWNHMMSQTRIGYTSWQQPETNIMPRVVERDVPETPALGVALEGSETAWTFGTAETALAFDAFNRPTRYLDVFNQGRGSFAYEVRADPDWIRVDAPRGTVEQERRLLVSLDWARVPEGTPSGTLTIVGPDHQSVRVPVTAFHPAAPWRAGFTGFVEADGYVAIEAANFTARRDTAAARWEEIPDFGRTRSGMSLFPVTAPSVTPPEGSPVLEYRMRLFTTNAVTVTAVLAPCLNYDPRRSVRVGVSFNDQPPQILTVVPQGYSAGDGNRDWEQAVSNSARYVQSAHQPGGPGEHTLKVWMVDPGIVLERLVVDTGGVRPSYLGPPESFRVPGT